jgi:hypothetical protein
MWTNIAGNNLPVGSVAAVSGNPETGFMKMKA